MRPYHRNLAWSRVLFNLVNKPQQRYSSYCSCLWPPVQTKIYRMAVSNNTFPNLILLIFGNENIFFSPLQHKLPRNKSEKLRSIKTATPDSSVFRNKTSRLVHDENSYTGNYSPKWRKLTSETNWIRSVSIDFGKVEDT